MKLELVTGDITGAVAGEVDAIVNAANSTLLGGGGVDGAIHRAGGPEILAACREIRINTWPKGLPTGKAVSTTAGKLPCQWVIHTVGPVFSADNDQRDLLRSCYLNSLTVADSLGAASVAFPLISAGVYRWPKQDAICQALNAITSADTQVQRVLLVLFDADTLTLAQSLVNG